MESFLFFFTCKQIIIFDDFGTEPLLLTTQRKPSGFGLQQRRNASTWSGDTRKKKTKKPPTESVGGIKPLSNRPYKSNVR